MNEETYQRAVGRVVNFSGVAISSRGSAVMSASTTTAEVDREKVGSANSPWRLTVDPPGFVSCRGFSVRELTTACRDVGGLTMPRDLWWKRLVAGKGIVAGVGCFLSVY
ncbi:unnamed protein product [Arabidopsis thaliana]|uniref:Uncharacterized protein n=1 Tax=Arabidopsis thaliana TaxID=3702 RepID=A0A654FKR6_ARATH|nr:unnamed protein product [Arabidopsis thaliana]